MNSLLGFNMNSLLGFNAKVFNLFIKYIPVVFRIS